MKHPIACIGAANIDVKAHCLQPPVMGSSNPVRVEERFGGVARNVCETLSRLGAQVGLIAPIAEDDQGQRLTQHARQLGAIVMPVRPREHFPTARYTALLDSNGNLVVGMADLQIADQLKLDDIQPVVQRLADYPIWFLDTNLPVEILAHLSGLKTPETLLAIDCVSVAKTARLTPMLDQADVVFANVDEAAALTKSTIKAPLDIITAANQLRDRGVGTVIVSHGPQGCYVACKSFNTFLPAYPVEVSDVTGAGDALAAATVFGLAAGKRIDQSVALGLAAAALTCRTTETVSAEITQATLERMISDAQQHLAPR